MTDTLLKQATVARRLGISWAHVRNLDAQLKPVFTEEGTRMYRSSVVEQYAARRDATKAMHR